jgi:hypothetical protein
MQPLTRMSGQDDRGFEFPQNSLWAKQSVDDHSLRFPVQGAQDVVKK